MLSLVSASLREEFLLVSTSVLELRHESNERKAQASGHGRRVVKQGIAAGDAARSRESDTDRELRVVERQTQRGREAGHLGRGRRPSVVKARRQPAPRAGTVFSVAEQRQLSVG